jgi:hypothetical protein
MKYLGQIKRHEGLKKRIMEGYSRKEEERATKKEMGLEYHRRFTNNCIGCGTSCL